MRLREVGGGVCAAFDTVLKTQQHQTFVLPDGNVTMRSRRLLVTDSDAAADATDAQRGAPGGAGGGAQTSAGVTAHPSADSRSLWRLCSGVTVCVDSVYSPHRRGL